MYFAETIVRNPGATFEVRCGAALIDAALIGAAVLGLSFLTAAIGLGPLVWMADIPAESGLTSRYGIDLFGIVRVVLETFAAPDAAGPSYPAFASVFSWGRTEAVVSLTGAFAILGIGMAYYIVCESAAGATPGKLVFGTRVRDETNRPVAQGTITARNLWKLLPLAVLLGLFVLGNLLGGTGVEGAAGIALAALSTILKIGAVLFAALAFGCAAFSYRNRALHDMMAGTRVIVPSA